MSEDYGIEPIEVWEMLIAQKPESDEKAMMKQIIRSWKYSLQMELEEFERLRSQADVLTGKLEAWRNLWAEIKRVTPFVDGKYHKAVDRLKKLGELP